MTLNQKIDFALLALHSQTKSGTMLKMVSAFTENGQKLTSIELREIKNVMEENEYAVFQIEPKGIDYRGQITNKGIAFVETSSFSKPGTSILNL